MKSEGKTKFDIFYCFLILISESYPDHLLIFISLDPLHSSRKRSQAKRKHYSPSTCVTILILIGSHQECWKGHIPADLTKSELKSRSLRLVQSLLLLTLSVPELPLKYFAHNALRDNSAIASGPNNPAVSAATLEARVTGLSRLTHKCCFWLSLGIPHS